MKFQLDYFVLLEADKVERPKRHVVADVDATERKAEYERLMREDPAFAKAHANDFQPQPATNDNAFMLKVVEWLKRGSASQKTLGGVTCRGLFMLTQAAASAAPGRMEPVVLDLRNRALAQRIMQSPDDRISSPMGRRTIEAPEHNEGQLPGLGN